MSKRWVMVAAGLLLCAAPSVVLAAAESMVTLSTGREAPSGGFKDIAKSGSTASLTAGYRVTRWLEAGADVSYFRNLGSRDGRQLVDVIEPNNSAVTLTLAENFGMTEVGAYGRAFIHERGRFSPYLRAGAGAYSVRYSQDVSASSAVTTVGGVEEQNKFGVSGGLGLRYRFLGQTSVGFEALYHRVFAKHTDLDFWTAALNLGFGQGPVTAPAAGSPAPAAPLEVLKRGSQWMSMRAGYSKASGKVSPDGRMGFGFGYRRFVLNDWSVGGFAQYELLGNFGRSADIEVPLTLEVARHMHWGSAVYPYVGLGAGAFYHKLYRTGADASSFAPGRYLTFGAYTPVRSNGLLGVDVRLAMVDRPPDNPVFPGADQTYKLDDLLGHLRDRTSGDKGPDKMLYSDSMSKQQLVWGFKLDYTITY